MLPDRMYLLFSGTFHRALGGYNDYRGCFPTIEKAYEYYLQGSGKTPLDPDEIEVEDWFHIVDVATGRLVWLGGNHWDPRTKTKSIEVRKLNV